MKALVITINKKEQAVPLTYKTIIDGKEITITRTFSKDGTSLLTVLFDYLKEKEKKITKQHKNRR